MQCCTDDFKGSYAYGPGYFETAAFRMYSASRIMSGGIPNFCGAVGSDRYIVLRLRSMPGSPPVNSARRPFHRLANACTTGSLGSVALFHLHPDLSHEPRPFGFDFLDPRLTDLLLALFELLQLLLGVILLDHDHRLHYFDKFGRRHPVGALRFKQACKLFQSREQLLLLC